MSGPLKPINNPNKKPPVIKLLDSMKDGREYESLLPLPGGTIEVKGEVAKSLKEISDCTGRYPLVYCSDFVKKDHRDSAINYHDETPFSEMIDAVPKDVKAVDILLITPGGSGEVVEGIVKNLRNRFDHVTVIVPWKAMSAGTLLALSGDQIIMDQRACIGPIDPQFPGKDGRYYPAQALFTLKDELERRIQDKIKKGEKPDITDQNILLGLDPKELGRALSSTAYSVGLAKDYLAKYKFKTWDKHTSSGAAVTDADRIQRASEVAEKLCSHSTWLSHSKGISIDEAWDLCKLKIESTSSVPGLERAVRRFWGLFCYIFERTDVLKLIISEHYSVIRSVPKLTK